MQSLPFPPSFYARVAQTTEHGGSNAGDEGEIPSASAIFQGVMSAADGLVRNQEDAGATPATLTISGRQAEQ